MTTSKREKEDDSGKVIPGRTKKKKQGENKGQTTVDMVSLTGVVTIKATLCYCAENVNTAVLINSCTELQLSQ